MGIGLVAKDAASIRAGIRAGAGIGDVIGLGLDLSVQGSMYVMHGLSRNLAIEYGWHGK